MNSFLKDIRNALRTAFFVKRCSYCGEVVFPNENLCDECKTALRPQGELCSKCGLEKSKCTCKKYNYKCEYDEFTAPFIFTNSIAKGVIRFKSYGYTELAKPYADEIVAAVKENFDSVDFDCVTYVPLHKSRLRKRGYNQAKLLAQAVADDMDLPLGDLLIKVRRTKSQRSSTARERRANLHGAFDLPLNESADGKRILLIDDIKTTGSTLSECALTLRAYGAKRVSAAAVAVVDETVQRSRK